PASPAPPAPAPPGSMPVESSVGVPAAPAAPGAAGSPVLRSVVIAPVSAPASMAPVSSVPVSMVVSAIAPVSSVTAGSAVWRQRLRHPHRRVPCRWSRQSACPPRPLHLGRPDHLSSGQWSLPPCPFLRPWHPYPLCRCPWWCPPSLRYRRSLRFHRYCRRTPPGRGWCPEGLL